MCLSRCKVHPPCEHVNKHKSRSERPEDLKINRVLAGFNVNLTLSPSQNQPKEKTLAMENISFINDVPSYKPSFSSRISYLAMFDYLPGIFFVAEPLPWQDLAVQLDPSEASEAARRCWLRHQMLGHDLAPAGTPFLGGVTWCNPWGSLQKPHPNHWWFPHWSMFDQ